MHYLENIFSWPTDKLHGYGWFHLTFVILIIVISTLFIIFGKEDEKHVRRVVFIFGLFFAGLEVYKQLFYNVFNDVDSYQWWIFPFQFCSTPLYLCLSIYLWKPRFQKYLYEFLGLYGILGGLAVMVNPDSVLNGEVTLCLQTMLWHSAMIVLAIYLIKVNHFGKNYLELVPSTIICLIIIMIAMTINVTFEILKRNNLVSGTLNLLYISPFYDNEVFILTKIRLATNWYVYFLSYVLALILGAHVIFGLCALVNKIKNKKCGKKNQNVV